ncbi:acyl-CoA reductase [Rhodohalobacter sp. 8-1]|uniref:acyl-CoA reductase n=1 Tax=Rhodohalobacter sp. 8-1 TaxID=3131972 RepID=UPI0030EE9CD4
MNKKIDELQEAIEEWLSPDNYRLKEAIDKTVNEGLFSFPDVKYQLLSLKKTLKKGEFHRWIESSGADLSMQENQKTVLCLHAGNLPLVGIQDILAVVLSNNRYLGKLSRKDPYLSQTLLDILKKRDLLDGRWSADLEDFKDETQKADALLFSGSTESVDPVIDALKTHNLADDSTPKLVRTAHYSIALIEDDRPDTFRQLADAVLRYGGSGCRSVAMVVAPFGLKSKKCEFTDYVEEFWLTNPQHKKPAPSLYHRFAYNKATEIEQSWLDDFLIEETKMEPSESFILHWVKGDIEKLKDLARTHRDGLQTIYVTNPDHELPSDLPKPELLSHAQQPPIWWRPDGVDPLKWLV